MKRLAGVLCAFLGITLLIGGFVAFFYEKERVWVGRTGMGVLVVHYPYIYLAIPLVVLGVVLIIAGAFLYFYTPKEAPSSRTMNMPQRRFRMRLLLHVLNNGVKLN